MPIASFGDPFGEPAVVLVPTGVAYCLAAFAWARLSPFRPLSHALLRATVMLAVMALAHAATLRHGFAHAEFTPRLLFSEELTGFLLAGLTAIVGCVVSQRVVNWMAAGRRSGTAVILLVLLLSELALIVSQRSETPQVGLDQAADSVRTTQLVPAITTKLSERVAVRKQWVLSYRSNGIGCEVSIARPHWGEEELPPLPLPESYTQRNPTSLRCPALHLYATPRRLHVVVAPADGPKETLFAIDHERTLYTPQLMAAVLGEAGRLYAEHWLAPPVEEPDAILEGIVTESVAASDRTPFGDLVVTREVDGALSGPCVIQVWRAGDVVWSIEPSPAEHDDAWEMCPRLKLGEALGAATLSLMHPTRRYWYRSIAWFGDREVRFPAEASQLSRQLALPPLWGLYIPACAGGLALWLVVFSLQRWLRHVHSRRKWSAAEHLGDGLVRFDDTGGAVSLPEAGHLPRGRILVAGPPPSEVAQLEGAYHLGGGPEKPLRVRWDSHESSEETARVAVAHSLWSAVALGIWGLGLCALFRGLGVGN